MRKNIRIGVFGTWRGNAYIKSLYQGKIQGARITALCDKNPKRIEEALENCPKGKLAPKTFSDAEDFFASGLFDAVFLCNYFPEHAKYAIKALELGIHVFSETIAAPTMADAVALCRAAEKSKAIYMMAENYPYSRGCFEMKRVYEEGTLGKVMFAEGEYVHPMGPADTIKYQNAADNGQYHWRRYLPATYYCSHALAPLIFTTGELPRRVVAMSAIDTPQDIIDYKRLRADNCGVMLINTDKNSVFRINGSSYFAPKGNWYRLSCRKGGIETVRGHEAQVRLTYNKWDRPTEETPTDTTYEAQWQSNADEANACGHAGGDYWVVRYFIEAIKGERKPFPDVYTACTMAAVGILGWRSLLNDNKAYNIPDFRNEEERKYWEDDRINPFPSEDALNNVPYSTIPVEVGEDW